LSGGAKASPFFFLRGPLATPDAIISRRFTGGGFTVDYSRFAEKYLDIKVNDGVAVVTLNRPERRNAIGADMHLGLEELFHEASFDVDLRAIVLTGAGEKAFSAGGDVSEFGKDLPGKGTGYLFRGPRYLIQNMLNCEVPIVAAINGYAIGLGATLALLSDIIYMADTATIADTHVNVGLTAGDGGAVIWPHLVGIHRAKEMLLLGKRVSAADAERYGLVNYVVPADKLMDEAMACAGELAKGAPFAIRWTKMALNRQLWQTLNNVLEFGLATEAMTMATQDHKEAVSAFAEKRAPKFTGK
jgi:enoyl-CoA hydratase